MSLFALSLLLLGAQTPAVPGLFFIRDSSVSASALALVAKLPNLDNRELNQLELVMQMLPQGSLEFSDRTIRSVLEGAPLHCRLTADAAVISFAVPAGMESQGEDLLISLIKDPSLQEDSIPGAIEALSHRDCSYFDREVDPKPFALTKATHQELIDVLRKVFSLDRIQVGAVCAKNLPKLTEVWNREAATWPKPPEERLTEDPPPFIFPDSQPKVATAEWIGPELDAHSADFPAEMLALYALGTGKVCSLYRISREEHAWSYEQEAFFEPTLQGWTPRLFVAMAPDPANRERLTKLDEQLKGDVAMWDANTRTAALGMAEANLERQVPYGPLSFAGETLDRDAEQRLAFGMYWMGKTGHEWNREELLEAFGKIDLPRLKATALTILASSQVHFLPAQPGADK
jgi:hypothetical protein